MIFGIFTLDFPFLGLLQPQPPGGLAPCPLSSASPSHTLDPPSFSSLPFSCFPFLAPGLLLATRPVGSWATLGWSSPAPCFVSPCLQPVPLGVGFDRPLLLTGSFFETLVVGAGLRGLLGLSLPQWVLPFLLLLACCSASVSASSFSTPSPPNFYSASPLTFCLSVYLSSRYPHSASFLSLLLFVLPVNPPTYLPFSGCPLPMPSITFPLLLLLCYPTLLFASS